MPELHATGRGAKIIVKKLNRPSESGASSCFMLVRKSLFANKKRKNPFWLFLGNKGAILKRKGGLQSPNLGGTVF